MYRCYNKAVKYARKKRVPDCEKRSRLLRRWYDSHCQDKHNNTLTFFQPFVFLAHKKD